MDATCDDAQLEALETLVAPDDYGILNPFIQLYWDEEPLSAFCRVCSERIELSYLVGREQAWEQLPALFGLTPWAAMVQDREQMLA